MPWAHDQVKNGVGALPVIAFVEDTLFVMVNHHTVNVKMDCMTDQADHNSFIILCLF